MTAKRKSKGAYMISAVAEMYEIHPQTLRLYEREGLLKPSRTEGNTRLYTDEDLERLEFILNLARDSGREYRGDRDHSADARADGRDESPDAELRRVCALGDADALPAVGDRIAGGNCAAAPDRGDAQSGAATQVVASPPQSPRAEPVSARSLLHRNPPSRMERGCRYS